MGPPGLPLPKKILGFARSAAHAMSDVKQCFQPWPEIHFDIFRAFDVEKSGRGPLHVELPPPLSTEGKLSLFLPRC